MLIKLDWLPLILIDCGVTILARHLVIFSDLTHFWSMFPFYTPWKHQKNKVLLVFSGAIKLEHWPVNLNAIIMPSHFDWAYRLENKVSAYVKKKTILTSFIQISSSIETRWSPLPHISRTGNMRFAWYSSSDSSQCYEQQILTVCHLEILLKTVVVKCREKTYDS